MYGHLEAKPIVDISQIYDLTVGIFIKKLTTGFKLNWSTTNWSFSPLFMLFDTYEMMQNVRSGNSPGLGCRYPLAFFF